MSNLLDKYEKLVNLLIRKGLSISTMESCTGGQIASYITDVEGSSNIIKGAFVTYANEAKILNGVDEDIIKEKGVYSFDTARAMALACRNTYRSNIGIGVTGTFSNTDPNNADSVSNNVFVSIIVDGEYTDIPVKVKEEKRYKAKDEIAMVIADKLLELIK